jgi:drug/metabolite transporter (DMT)-like permease
MSVYSGGFLLGGITGPAIGGPMTEISLRLPFFFYAATLGVAVVITFALLGGPSKVRRSVTGDAQEPAQAPAEGAREALRIRLFRAATVANFSANWSNAVRTATVPLFVTLLAMARGRTPLPPRRLVALGLITAGVAVSGALVGGGASLGGVGLLLVGGFAWAVFTTGLQRTSLTLLQMVLTICTVSSSAALVLAVSGAMPSHLLAGTAELGDVVVLTLLQGIGTGLMSTLCYAFAVRALGSSRASVGGAVSPVLTAVVAVPVFGEQIGLGLAVALMLIVAGVAVFNRVGAASASADDASGLEPEDVVRGGDALLVVRDAHDRGPAGGLLGEDLAGALPAGGIEPRGGLVQEQDLRVLDDALSQ